VIVPILKKAEKNQPGELEKSRWEGKQWPREITKSPAEHEHEGKSLVAGVRKEGPPVCGCAPAQKPGVKNESQGPSKSSRKVGGKVERVKHNLSGHQARFITPTRVQLGRIRNEKFISQSTGAAVTFS